jgi:hypothetical protein
MRADAPHVSLNSTRTGESGNVLFYILIGIVLIAIVTAAVRMGGGQSQNIDKEQVLIAASQIRQYASELERGTALMLQNGISESAIRFANPAASTDYGDITDIPSRQEFDKAGGAVGYQLPPGGANDGSLWEFYGDSQMPGMGSPSRSNLIAVLPDVTLAVCTQLNSMDGFTAGTQPKDPGTCVNQGASARFSDSVGYDDTASKNTADQTTFSFTPAPEACVQCDDGKYYFYHVLIAR